MLYIYPLAVNVATAGSPSTYTSTQEWIISEQHDRVVTYSQTVYNNGYQLLLTSYIGTSSHSVLAAIYVKSCLMDKIKI